MMHNMMDDKLFHKYAIFSVTVLFVVVLDQATKAYISSTMLLFDSSVIIKGFLNLTYVRNPGAAFGFLSHASPLFRSLFFVLVSLAAVGIILYYLVTSHTNQRWFVFALSLVLGGAVGNLIDRIRFQEVIDFIDVYWRTYHWPAFNVADSAISLGAVIMILHVVKRHHE